MDTGHWQHPWKSFDIDDWTGFVYVITCTANNRKYIGKKFFHSTTRKQVAGKTRRKKVVKESDWKKYTGSSKALNDDIQLYGKNAFRFEIVSLHETRSSLSWEEARQIVLHDALRAKNANGEKLFYNGILGPVKFSITDETELERQYRHHV
ncbi:hypothetical protein [Terriglobus roseus]|uniref:Putative endonuclease SegE-like GIY-YIG domain-containing protein n=1 Tax=Terriglobus roseus TaxID=392734 RepID=A0A1G7G541_9BACT|nr:hypothetical protein [Terriglobus roseus]SDE83195.1 hypothetical protein SAMN05444167_0553 [Terriglobus roseus]